MLANSIASSLASSAKGCWMRSSVLLAKAWPSCMSVNQVSRLLIDGLHGHQTQSSMHKIMSGQLWPYDHQDGCYHQASPSIWQPCGNRLADWTFACTLSVCCLHDCSQHILTWCSPMMPLRVKHLHPSMRSWTGGSSPSLGGATVKPDEFYTLYG